jgi:ubiquinone/menaquinone biosynthesis C-methylase UbiE
MSDTEPHSVLYFGDARDHWWSPDFLALIAARTELGRRGRVLDVGTGFGHFARALLPHLRRGVELSGVDPEPVSIAESERRTAGFVKARGLDARLSFVVGRVEALPFPDASFEAVVAQTVMIHLADIRAAIAEMARVLVPGGLLLLAEPNNVSSSIGARVHGPDLDPERLLRLASFELRVEVGKARLGLGFNSAGEYLAKYLANELFEDVRAWCSDKAYLLAPPYATEAEQAQIAEKRDFVARGIFGWPRAEARRYYLAGGGREDELDREYDFGLEVEREELAEIDGGTFARSMASTIYLFAATRARGP